MEFIRVLFRSFNTSFFFYYFKTLSHSFPKFFRGEATDFFHIQHWRKIPFFLVHCLKKKSCLYFSVNMWFEVMISPPENSMFPAFTPVPFKPGVNQHHSFSGLDICKGNADTIRLHRCYFLPVYTALVA